MIEHGLEEAATCGGERLLSPTLHSARYGSRDSDEYLEIHYHDDKPVLRNSTGSVFEETENTEGKAELNRSLSVEPESLTMDRDCEVDGESESSVLSSDYVKVESEVNDNHDNPAEKLAIGANCDNKHCDNTKEKNIDNNSTAGHMNSGILIGDHNFGETKIVTSNSHDKIISAKNDKHSHDDNNQPKTPSSADSGSTHTDPFLNMNTFTQIQAVQTGETIQNNSSVINIEEYAEKCEEFDENEKPSSLELSLNLEDLRRSNSIEDIDSPESIKKIDSEDCFSWEEDSLLLTINPVLGDHSEHKDTTEKVDDKSQTEEEVIVENKSGNQPRETINTATTNSQSEDLKNDGKSTTDNSEVKVEEKDSPSKKAAALKNKLSNAFGGFNVKEKIRNRKTNNNKMIPMQDLKDTIPVIPKLKQDNCGFPLVIFTKVGIIIILW